MTNTNCLADMQCPQCRSFEPFNIEVKTKTKVFDNGTDDYGDTEWEENSYWECCECGFCGTVKDFSGEAQFNATACRRFEDVVDALEFLMAALSPRKTKPVLEAAGYDTKIWLAAYRHARSVLRKP